MATETSALEGLEPGAFWGHFEALTKIPRPSRREEPVIEHVRRWAADDGFELVHDSGRNLVIRVPATAGRASDPGREAVDGKFGRVLVQSRRAVIQEQRS